MKPVPCPRVAVLFCAVTAAALAWPVLPEDFASEASSASAVAKLQQSIRVHMEYLASDSLQGRGSGTHQEHIATEYVASELRRYGVAPAGDHGGYLQHVALEYRTLAAPPVLTVEAPLAGESGSAESAGIQSTWTHAHEMAVAWLGSPDVSGPLQKITDPHAKIKSGAVVFLAASENPWRTAYDLTQLGAAMVLVPDSPIFESLWEDATHKLPRFPPRITRIPEAAGMHEMTLVVLRESVVKILKSLPEGTAVHLESRLNPVQPGQTWNALGVLRGSDPILRDEAVLFSAHIDHLGKRRFGKHVAIYHGADDDASGVAAVLELARAMAAGPPPRRTVLFAFFGSEERGGLGSTYFSEFPPVPLASIIAALEFEMLGRPDQAIPAHKLWLSGYERSDLGSVLAEHGAPLVADPHAGEHFFERSDNYPLARKGIVAHTVSSYGLHKDYHRPTDDLAHINFPHLDGAIESIIPAAEWLANSDFKPHWLPGEKP